MAIFTSDEGEGGTIAERIAVIGIICFAFSWIPIFIIWKLSSTYRRRSRSQEQELEAGNMPFQTNPSKPKRNSWKPPPQVRQSIELTRNPQELPPTAQGRDGLQKEYRGKRRPMPTQPTDPKIRMLSDNDDAAIEVQHNRSEDLQHESSRSRLFEQPAQPLRASLRHQSPPVDHDSDESFGAPGPSFRVPRNYRRSGQDPR
ncbi:hypothetical protein INS49_003786 [Diaporthe citri]|uniref:uncharacterized protein n=1 Tax=Diaporthe citri TaxID=83186 RepID=UPI001C814418|nr:uncharacterized protein INS49_003786 [Diaporthe citri]KAG6355820.1 hypothetical protein INS49_003786 [Diaporthe citri]